jgi:hypothetical protein
MSWSLIKSIQKDTDLRLVLPFGLNLRIGDVISVGKSGNFRLEGSCETLLGLPRPRPRDAGGRINLLRQSGEDTKIVFRAAGTASTLFDGLPSANAGFDISFGSSEAWVLALVDRALHSLAEVDRYGQSILQAHVHGAWKPDWALVTSVATASRMTLLAAAASDTRIALSLNATVATDAPMEVKLTAGASIAAANQQLIQCITSDPMAVACSAVRVREGWFRAPNIGDLELAQQPMGQDDSSRPAEFWEDVDDLN